MKNALITFVVLKNISSKLCILLLLISFISNAQKSKKKKQKQENYASGSYDLIVGYKVLKTNYYNQFNTSINPNTALPFNQIGIGLSNYHFAATHLFSLDFNMSYLFFIPSSITLQDSLKTNINGFNYHLSFGKNLLKNKSPIALNIWGGFNTGRSILRGKDNLHLKNPYFSPCASFQFKAKIKHICFSTQFIYEYDVSNKNWKKTLGNTQFYNLEKFNQTGYTILISLGYLTH